MLSLLLLLCCAGPAAPEPEPAEAPAGAPRVDLGADPCLGAWSELEAAADALRAQYGELVQAPERAPFMQACAALPAEARPCLSMRTYIAQEAECVAQIGALPPEARDALERALVAAP